MNGVELIRQERRRQRSRSRCGEAYSLAHDDDHDRGEIARAAAVYAMPPEFRQRNQDLVAILNAAVLVLEAWHGRPDARACQGRRADRRGDRPPTAGRWPDIGGRLVTRWRYRLLGRWLCHCRGYHERMGFHAEGCPRFRPDRRDDETR